MQLTLQNQGQWPKLPTRIRQFFTAIAPYAAAKGIPLRILRKGIKHPVISNRAPAGASVRNPTKKYRTPLMGFLGPSSFERGPRNDIVLFSLPAIREGSGLTTFVLPMIATFFSDKKVAKKSVGLFSLAINAMESLAPARSHVALLRNALKAFRLSFLDC